MSDKQKCPDCGGEIEQGFIPDSIGRAVMQQMCWHPGTAEDKTFLGMKTGTGLEYDRENLTPVTAARCTGCWLLKFYANR